MWRLTPLLRWMGPLQRNVPAGTTTRPPPALLHSSMALTIDGRALLVSPVMAPKSVMTKSLLGHLGAAMRLRMASICDQPSSGAAATGRAARRPVRNAARRKGEGCFIKGEKPDGEALSADTIPAGDRRGFGTIPDAARRRLVFESMSA